MKASLPKSDWQTIDEYVAGYESAWTGERPTALAEHLPPADDPHFVDVLLELVRVDLELRWQRGCPRPLDDYLRDYGAALGQPERLAQLAYEEYRARRQAGESVTPEHYAQRYGVVTRSWPSGAMDAPAGSLEPAAEAFPAAPGEYLGFELLKELGRGAFSRVFLARQGDLAKRLVVLKVSTSSWDEADKLAQCQHAHIVPIYSVHRDGPLCAVCMPYFGATTLADVVRSVEVTGVLPATGWDLLATLAAKADATWHAQAESQGVGDGKKDAVDSGAMVQSASPAHDAARLPDLQTLRGLTYVEAVLWIGARLASGLDHAHARGIVHRDLKPANILLADDGRPMLLDFNLSADTKRLPGGDAVVGGTLPYMAPEQIAAFQERRACVDPRSDVYALGVILFELLAGRLPFPVAAGPLEQRAAAGLRDRMAGAPKLRVLAPQVTPAVQSIVERCLAPRPEDRYPSADVLREDLQRQLDHLPLKHAADPSPLERSRKWLRRHPRLTSASGMGFTATLALALLAAALMARGQRIARFEAQAAYQDFQRDLLHVRTESLLAATERGGDFDNVLAHCNAALHRFDIAENDDWQRRSAAARLAPDQQLAVRQGAAEILRLMAALSNNRAAQLAEPEREQLSQQAMAFHDRAEKFAPVGQAETGTSAAPLGSDHADDLARQASLLALERRFRAALPLWQKAASENPTQVWIWYGLAQSQAQLGEHEAAVASLTACVALAPAFDEGYFQRGVSLLSRRQFAAAAADFERTLQLAPEHSQAAINLGLCLLGQGQAERALAGLTQAIDRDPKHDRLYLMRAQTLENLHDQAGAQRDRQQALQLTPRDEHGWIARGVAQLAHDPAAALDSFAAAQRHNPYSLPARENQAHVLAEHLGKTEAAIVVLNDAVRVFPDNAILVATRGVLSARLGQRDAAIRDARQALAIHDSAATRYHAAGVYARLADQSADDRVTALALLASALSQGYGADLLEQDVDLGPLRNDAEFQKLTAAVQLLQVTSQVPVQAVDASQTAERKMVP